MRDQVKLKVKGSVTFVINQCRKAGITVYSVAQSGDATLLTVGRRDQKRCEKILLDTKRDYDIVGRLGGFFLVKNIFFRVGVWLGVAVIVLLASLYSQYVFGVDVIGDELSFVEEAYIALEGIEMPIKKADVDLEEIERRAEQVEGVSYATATVVGSRLKLTVVGEEIPHAVIDLSKPCDMVATKDAIVTRVVVYQGTPTVSVGDIVKKGSTLVQGRVDLTEELSIDVAATGEVYGLVYHTEVLSIPIERITRRRTGRTKSSTDVCFLKWGKVSPPPFDCYEVETEEVFSLPLINLSVIRRTYYETEDVVTTVEDSDLTDIVSRAQSDFETRLASDATLKKKSHEIKRLDNYYILELYYQTEEKIYESKNY